MREYIVILLSVLLPLSFGLILTKSAGESGEVAETPAQSSNATSDPSPGEPLLTSWLQQVAVGWPSSAPGHGGSSTSSSIIETAATSLPFPDSPATGPSITVLGPSTSAPAANVSQQQPEQEQEHQEICQLACQCGLTNKELKIVGGVETMVNEYPWVALLLYRGRFYCGATVINSQYVMTAAHCVSRFSPSLITVRVLEHDRLATSETLAQEFKVEKIVKHMRYSTSNYDNDIALIRVVSPFNFTNKFRPACLPEPAKTFAGQNGIVTGWGATSQGGLVSPVLREVTVPILSNSECRQTKYPARKITDNMLCAGYKEGQKDSCQGDSGGSLHVVGDDSIYSVAGVVSWGEGCAKPDYPGVYTRVNRYLTWIKRNTEDACYCADNYKH